VADGTADGTRRISMGLSESTIAQLSGLPWLRLFIFLRSRRWVRTHIRQFPAAVPSTAQEHRAKIVPRPARNSLSHMRPSRNNQHALQALSSPYWEGRLYKKKLSHGRFEDPYKDKVFCWLSSDGVLYVYPAASATHTHTNTQRPSALPSLELLVLEHQVENGVGLERYSLLDYIIVEEKESVFRLCREAAKPSYTSGSPSSPSSPSWAQPSVAASVVKFKADSQSVCMEWVTILQEKKRDVRCLQVLHRAVNRLRNRDKARALDTWHTHISNALQHKRVMRRVLMRMKHRNLCARLAFWHEQVLDEQNKRQTESNIITRMKHRLLAASITRWTQSVAEEKEEEEEEERRQAVLRRILTRMVQHSVSLALDRWVENVAELKAIAGKGRKAVLRWKSQACARCAGAWRIVTEEELWKRHVMTEILVRLKKRALSFFWDVWVGFVDERGVVLASEELRNSAAVKILAKQKTKEFRRQTAMMLKITQRLKHTTAARCLEAWRVYLDDVEEAAAALGEEERKQAVMRRILSRMVQRTTALALDRWMEVVEEAADRERERERLKELDELEKVREREREALVRLIKERELEWERGRERESWAARAEEERKQAVMHRILARMVQRSVSQALDRWVENVAEAAAARAEEERRRAVMRRILARIVQRSVSQALDRWVENVAELKTMAAKGSKVVRRWKLKVPSKSLMCSLRFCSVNEGVRPGD
jgi:hypothetical protein